MTIAARLDDIGKPAWIALMIVGFLLWWPVGLVVLGYLIGSGRMGCWMHRQERWQRRMDRMQQGMERMQQAASSWGSGVWRAPRPSLERHSRVRRVSFRDIASARRRAARFLRVPEPAAPRQGQGR